MNERIYPDPDINLESEAYWAGSNAGKLLVKRCTDCEKHHHFPRAICPHCFSDATEWVEASGRGTVYSYSVTRRADPPYAICYVRLEEGITMLSNLVEADFDKLEVEMPVEVTFLKTENGQALPVFRPAGEEA